MTLSSIEYRSRIDTTCRLVLSALFFHEDLFFRKLILSETASFVLGSSFTKTRSTITSHFDYEFFVIIKTFLRRSFGDRLYIISFTSSLASNFKSRPLAIVPVLFCTGTPGKKWFILYILTAK
jgi:hypothetical protein